MIATFADVNVGKHRQCRWYWVARGEIRFTHREANSARAHRLDESCHILCVPGAAHGGIYLELWCCKTAACIVIKANTTAASADSSHHQLTWSKRTGRPARSRAAAPAAWRAAAGTSIPCGRQMAGLRSCPTVTDWCRGTCACRQQAPLKPSGHLRSSVSGNKNKFHCISRCRSCAEDHGGAAGEHPARPVHLDARDKGRVQWRSRHACAVLVV